MVEHGRGIIPQLNMLGWAVIIFREEGSGHLGDPHRIADWTVGPYGIKWLNRMVEDGTAQFLGGNGYPLKYSALWKDLLPELLNQPEGHTGPTVIGEDYVMEPGWKGKMTVNKETVARCLPDDRVTINCFDLS